jgi:ATPase subunit of ABC transporter with duplicated ATPase domains
MIHKPIKIKNFNLSFPHKICFDDFNTQINYGSRIAIIGNNGSGKSTLLKMLQGCMANASGEISVPDDVSIGYVPQIIEDFDTLSGGERLNAVLTKALSHDPNVLLLDEPTNHLDRKNRTSLLRMLHHYSGTLIVVSHDTELLRGIIDTLWHINHGKIHIFSGSYDHYMQEMHLKHTRLEQNLSSLKQQKKEMHHALMKEQQRAANSRAVGAKNIENRKWPTVVSKSKALRAEQTSGRKKSAIDSKKQALTEQLSNLQLPEMIAPKFHLPNHEVSNNRLLLSICDGEIRYQNAPPLLCKINLTLASDARLAITGNNGSGKSTLVKAILNDSLIIRKGDWSVPKPQDIGYLDQHYSTLPSEKTVFECIAELTTTWTHAEIRRHLNDFLFRKNEEVQADVKQLSGGEKARLSLACIAAKTPKLLILDEITNNLDLETREHVTQVLKAYPGAIIVISHDKDFLNDIGVIHYYSI